MRIHQINRQVAGAEGPGDCTIGFGTLHLAITEVLQAQSQSTTLVRLKSECSAHEVAAANVVHIVEPQLQVHLLAKQRRVLVNHIDVIVNKRNVLATHGIHFRRSGYVEKLVAFVATTLRKCRSGGNQCRQGQNQ